MMNLVTGFSGTVLTTGLAVARVMGEQYRSWAEDAGVVGRALAIKVTALTALLLLLLLLLLLKQPVVGRR